MTVRAPAIQPDSVTRCHSGRYLTILLLVTMLATGCVQTGPDGTGGISITDPLITASPQPDEIATPLPLTERIIPVRIPVKNVTITRPENSGSTAEKELPDTVRASVHAISDSRTAGGINSYLRWESVRVRTNGSEAARFNAMVRDIDTAIGMNWYAGDIILYGSISGDALTRILNESRYRDEGYVSGSYDPSVLYHSTAGTARDREGYLSLLVLQQKSGSHLLYLNETRREILLPRAMTWELTAAEEVDRVVFSRESVPRYPEEQMEQVRLLYLTPIT